MAPEKAPKSTELQRLECAKKGEKPHSIRVHCSINVYCSTKTNQPNVNSYLFLIVKCLF